MKFLNYTFAGVIGAAMATLVMQWMSVEPPAAAPVLVRPRMVPGQSSADFVRLNREKAELDAQLAEARAKLAEHDATLVQTKASLEELRRPMMTDMMSSALRAELKSGEVVVTGGYKLSNGKRLYAFAQPVIEQVDGKDVVKIESRFISLTDEAGKSVGLDSIATDVANTLQHGEVWVADEQTSVLAKLDASSGTDMLSSPTIRVAAGTSGIVEIGDLKLKVTPVISDDHTKMDFEVRLEQPQAPLPAVESPEVKPLEQAEGAQPPK